jgi:flagellar biosynthesis protein FlhG
VDQASRLRQIVGSYKPNVMSLSSSQSDALGVVHVNLFGSNNPKPVAVRRVPVVAITSGKGGVGKTSVAVNVCASLAQRHARVTLLDADLGLANADVLCGLTPTRRLDSVLDQGAAKRTLKQITVPAPGGFRLVPGSVGLARMANLPSLERHAILRAMLELEADNDLIVVDTGAGVSEGVMAFLRYADLVVVVVTPEPTSLADAYATIKLLRLQSATDAQASKLAVIVNQCRNEDEAHATMARIGGTCRRFLQFDPVALGWLHKDETLPTSVRQRGPVVLKFPDATISKDMRALAERLASEAGVRLVSPKKKQAKGWLSRLFGG